MTSSLYRPNSIYFFFRRYSFGFFHLSLHSSSHSVSLVFYMFNTIIFTFRLPAFPPTPPPTPTPPTSPPLLPVSVIKLPSCKDFSFLYSYRHIFFFPCLYKKKKKMNMSCSCLYLFPGRYVDEITKIFKCLYLNDALFSAFKMSGEKKNIAKF